MKPRSPGARSSETIAIPESLYPEANGFESTLGAWYPIDDAP